MMAMFYFLALNSGPVISGNDISVYPVTGIDLGFVLRDFSKVFSHTFRLDMAELTLRAVIKLYPNINKKNISKNVVFVLFLPRILASRNQTIYPICHAYSCKHYWN